MRIGKNCDVNERTLTVKQDGSGDYKTIQEAVDKAHAGDTILVYEGVYRETVIFSKGGNNESDRIILRGKEGERILITGSEVVKPEEWKLENNSVYVLEKYNSYFGEFNPFKERWAAKSTLYADYFSSGNVYINECALKQVFSLDDVYNEAMSWYVEVTNDKTIIRANFGSYTPSDKRNITEINKRKQCITAEWNLGYITISGFEVVHGCGPKTVNFAQYGSKPMEGAIGTNGGHHWIIENCKLYQNRGVAIDYGLGSRGHQEKNGGEPEIYGHHKIRKCYIHDNATNGAMAYRGAYTEICHCIFANNNTLNTGLLSEAYVKNVNSGFGISVHDNYFYSNHSWDTIPIWFDCELDGSSICNNIFYAAGADGHGLNHIYWEQSAGWCICANNIFIHTGLFNVNTSCVYTVNNLFLDNNKWNIYPGHKEVFTSYGYNGYSRVMRAMKPGSLTPISKNGKNGNSHYETFLRYNKMYNNIFFGSGLVSSPDLDEISEDSYNGMYYEFENVGSAAEEKDIWKALDKNYEPNATNCFGNECDYNVYYAGADKINYQYGKSHDYIADEHSIKVDGNFSYKVLGDEKSCTLILNVDDSARNIKAPEMTGQFLGNSALYEQLGYEFYAPNIEKDYFGEDRNTKSTVVGPFADLKQGRNIYNIWPKKMMEEML